ncbi:MAG: LysM peptidoglycan-binding domain-containing protein [Chloroflexi bacterium]|nr:MAG: LysM peptidoglycan-binding domain-containing protein [Chloroflexota bacterium]
MSNKSSSELAAGGENSRRCPHCDTVVAADAIQCIMCGAELPPLRPELAQTAELPPLPETPSAATSSATTKIFTSVMRERQSSATFWLTAVFGVIILISGILVWQYRDPNLNLALVPTVSPTSPPATSTHTPTPGPTETSPPTATPTITLTPLPTDTPRPPRLHTVASGETLIGLSLRYRITAESIAAANGFSVDAPIQAGQSLVIPWPTPTPPLVPVGIEINGETVIADPTDCQLYEVQPGDSLSGIAARYEIDFRLFLMVNRLSEDFILQPGDVVCIPQIIYGGTLPPTPGPSPTPSPTPLPPAPVPLFPPNHAVIDPPDRVITLQWAAVKNLAENEWYMVELADEDEIDSLPYRGFTRATSFQVPSSWRPTEPEQHLMRWRVSIVQVTGWRSDGLPLYKYGGQASEPSFFVWLGAVPTPTPTATATPVPTITPES